MNTTRIQKFFNSHKKIILETRDEWINRFFDNVKNKEGINKPLFEEGIKWIYEDLLHKKYPIVVYCDSWISCLLTIAVWASVWEIFEDYSRYGDISDFGWVSFYRFFTKTGVLRNPVFDKYSKFIESTAFVCYMY
jgi:hypothetical protein